MKDYSFLFVDDNSFKIKWYCYPIVWFLFVVSFVSMIYWQIRFKFPSSYYGKVKSKK